MPQGKGTYGSEVGRPPKNKEKKEPSPMDILTGADSYDIPTYDSGGRVKKYAIGGNVSIPQEHTVTGPTLSGDTVGELDVERLPEEKRGQAALRNYWLDTYGGSTTYDMAQFAAGDEETEAPVVLPDEGGNMMPGGDVVMPDWVGTFEMPDITPPTPPTPPQEEEEDTTTTPGGGTYPKRTQEDDYISSWEYADEEGDLGDVTGGGSYG